MSAVAAIRSACSSAISIGGSPCQLARASICTRVLCSQPCLCRLASGQRYFSSVRTHTGDSCVFGCFSPCLVRSMSVCETSPLLPRTSSHSPQFLSRYFASFYHPNITTEHLSEINSWIGIALLGERAVLFLAGGTASAVDTRATYIDSSFSIKRLELEPAYYLQSSIEARIEAVYDAVSQIPPADCYLLLASENNVKSRTPANVNRILAVSALSTAVATCLKMQVPDKVKICTIKKLVRCARNLSVPVDCEAIYGEYKVQHQLQLLVSTFGVARQAKLDKRIEVGEQKMQIDINGLVCGDDEMSVPLIK